MDTVQNLNLRAREILAERGVEMTPSELLTRTEAFCDEYRRSATEAGIPIGHLTDMQVIKLINHHCANVKMNDLCDND
jgi:hypothetical protein